MENLKYDIGLDIGTSSVGWAVIRHDNYKVMKRGKNALWGVRLFSDAETAESRRAYRSLRRRYKRRRIRIKLLQQEFKNIMDKIDSNFFKKIDESFFKDEDKKIKLTKNDKEWFKNYSNTYPTIYHLRKQLIEEDKKFDIRYVYLALHHIIKYRGNFNTNGELNNESNEKINEYIVNGISLLDDVYIEEMPNFKIDEFLRIIKEEKGKKDRKEKLKILFIDYLNELNINIDSKSIATQLSQLFVGSKFSLEKLYGIEENYDISFDSSDYEDKYGEIYEKLNDKIESLDYFNQAYSSLFIKKVFTNQDIKTISDYYVDRYNRHKKDLKYLKELFSDTDERKKLFKSTKKYTCIYDMYIHNDKNMEYSVFIKKISDFASKNNLVIKEDILKRMENGEFLPRISDKNNGKFPYQLNKKELELIIQNQAKYYPFLDDIVDINGKKYNRIERILSFKIPYYVGPIGPNNSCEEKGKSMSKYQWVKRKEGKENERITPFNFDDVVDKDASAEEFIRRMLGHCTYLINEYSIPNNSILYSKYKLLNELKNIRVENQKLSTETFKDIFDNLLMKKGKCVTETELRNYLVNNYGYSINVEIKGFSNSTRFLNNMESYNFFFGENGIFNETSYNEEDAEKIIEWITIFEDKNILKRKLLQEYTELSDKSVKSILSKKYKGWSNLSKKLLTEKVYLDKESGDPNAIFSIMDLLYSTDENFMQIINNDKYGIQKFIDKENSKNIVKNQELTYDIVDDLVTSPKNKRGIYQALKVVDELVRIIGYEPSCISLEMPRENGTKKKMTEDRKKKLENLYSSIKTQSKEYKHLYDKISKEELENIDDKLYLYYMQQGKCMYSGEAINIEKLHTDEYEIDHILPQSIIKDNSWDNRVLVKRECNQIKANSLIVPKDFQRKCNDLWKVLEHNGFISKSKVWRLTRIEYSDEDIKGFINRQLVETRQICKNVAGILNSLYKNTKIIYLKADVSHQYRVKNNLYKFRDLNDFHHAHDAYLAAVLGNYMNLFKMNGNISFKEVSKINKEIYNQGKDNYYKFRYGYLINSLDKEFSHFINLFDKKTGEVFDADYFNDVVINNLYRNDILVTKKVENHDTGQLFDATIYSCKDSKAIRGFSLKKGLDTEKYGGYSSIKPAYAVVLEYTKRGIKKQKLVGIPVYLSSEELNSEVQIKYIKEKLNISDDEKVEIIDKRIPFNSIIDWEGKICSLVSAGEKVEVCNAKQFFIEKKYQKKWGQTLDKLLNNYDKTIDDYNKYKDNKLDEKEYKANLDSILIYIIDKINTYYELYKNLEVRLNKFKEDSRIYNLKDKEKLIKELLNLLRFNSVTANLKDLKLSSSFGRMNERTISHAKIYSQSVTGLRNSILYEF